MIVDANALNAEILMYSIETSRAGPGTKAETNDGATMIIKTDKSAPAIACTLISVNSKFNRSISVCEEASPIVDHAALGNPSFNTSVMIEY